MPVIKAAKTIRKKRVPKTRVVRKMNGNAGLEQAARKAEKVIGLPRGSVRLVDLDGSPMPPDAKVKDLRFRWTGT